MLFICSKLRYYALLLWLCSGSSLFAWGWNNESDKGDGNNKTINNISINNTVNTSASAKLMESVLSKMDGETKKLAKNLNVSVQLLLEMSTALILKNKWKISFAAMGSGYTSIVYNNLRLKNYLLSNERWFHWAIQNIPTAHLTTNEFETISQSLIHEIQRRYITTEQPENFIEPLIQFIKSINQEINTIELYRKLGTIFNKTATHRYVYFDMEVYKKTGTWLEYAKLLKSIFLHWMANFKLQQQVHRVIISQL
jgi:hypothetical protein